MCFCRTKSTRYWQPSKNPRARWFWSECSLGGELAKFWLCAEECGFCLRLGSGRAGLLPGSDRRAKNQGQPTCAPQAGLSQGGTQASEREICIRRGIGFSHPQRHPVQRHEPAAQAPETGRSQAGDALAQLAHATPHSRDAFATRGRHAQRDAGTIGPHEDVNSNPRFATFELREEA